MPHRHAAGIVLTAYVCRLLNKAFKGSKRSLFTSLTTFAVGQESMAAPQSQNVDKDLYAKEQKLLLAAKGIDQALVERVSFTPFKSLA